MWYQASPPQYKRLHEAGAQQMVRIGDFCQPDVSTLRPLRSPHDQAYTHCSELESLESLN